MNEEILGGLKSAIDRGESLKRAMMTFYNSGYKKEEIEEAARFLNERPAETKPQTQVVVVKPKPKLFGNLFQKKPEQKPVPPKEVSIPTAPVEPVSKPSPQIVSSYGEKPEQKPVQKISSYEKQEKNPKDKILIAVLITILIILFAILAGIFLFKQQIINFFSSLLG
jgi:hypothetical protein